MNLLAAINGKQMGLIDLQSATPIAWSGPDTEQIAIHPDDDLVLQRACHILRSKTLTTNLVMVRHDVDGEWRSTRLKLALLSEEGQPVALVEVENFGEPPHSVQPVVQI